jgi:hypothetical protein
MHIRHLSFDPLGSPQTLADRLQQALRAGARAVLVLAGDGVSWPAEQVSPLLQALPAPVFGAVFPEVIFGVEHSATGLVVLGLDHQAEVTVVTGLNDPETDFGAALAATPATQDSVLVLVDGLAPCIARFIEAVFDHIGGGPSFIGGGGGSLSFQQRPCLFTPQGLLAGAALVVSLDAALAVGVRHGWQAIAGPFVVTGTAGNTVHQLDYRPAAEVYQACVGPQVQATLDSDNFFGHAKGYPFGIERFDGSLLVRDPIVMQGDSLVCVGEVPEQTAVHILRGDADRLIAAAAEGTEAALQQLGAPPGGGLLIDCISRVLFLGERFGEELATVQGRLQQAGGHQHPLFGALTLGEIANNGAQCLEFYNKTLVLGAYGQV